MRSTSGAARPAYSRYRAVGGALGPVTHCLDGFVSNLEATPPQADTTASSARSNALTEPEFYSSILRGP